MSVACLFTSMAASTVEAQVIRRVAPVDRAHASTVSHGLTIYRVASPPAGGNASVVPATLRVGTSSIPIDLWVEGSPNSSDMYVPLDGLDQALDSIGFRSTWDADSFTWAIQTSTPRADTWGLATGAGIGAVAVDGSLATRLNVFPGVDLTSGWNGSGTVFLPLPQVSQILADLGVQNAWDAASRVWTWVPPLQTSAPLGPSQGVEEVRSDIVASGSNIVLQNLQPTFRARFSGLCSFSTGILIPHVELDSPSYLRAGGFPVVRSSSLVCHGACARFSQTDRRVEVGRDHVSVKPNPHGVCPPAA